MLVNLNSRGLQCPSFAKRIGVCEIWREQRTHAAKSDHPMTNSIFPEPRCLPMRIGKNLL